MAYGETVAGLAILVALNLLFFRNNWGYFDANPHPFWLVVIPVAARYGALPGYSAGFLSASVYFLLIATQPRSVFAVDILSTRAMLNPVLFIIVGGALGELREAQKRAHTTLAAKYDDVQVALQDLAQRYLGAIEINRELERRIVSQTSTVTTLYHAAKALDQLDIEELSPSVLELTTSFIEAEACSLYLRKDGKLVLKAARPANVEFGRPGELDTRQGMIGIAVAEKRTVTVRDVLTEATPAQIMGQRLLMATPILGENQDVLGVLAVERMPFLRFTPTAVRLFTLLGDWASSAFQTALRFQQTQDRNVEDPLTGAYSFSYMMKRLHEEIVRARSYGFPLTLLALRIERYDAVPRVKVPSLLQTLGFIFRRHIRPMDMLGKYATEDIFLIALPHVAADEGRALALRIQQELEQFGFQPFDTGERLQVTVSVAGGIQGVGGPEELVERAIQGIRSFAAAQLPKRRGVS